MDKTLLFLGSHPLVHAACKLVCHHYSSSLYWDIREVRISHWLLWDAAIYRIYVRSQKSKRLVKQPLWHWDLSQYEADGTHRQRGGYRRCTLTAQEWNWGSTKHFTSQRLAICCLYCRSNAITVEFLVQFVYNIGFFFLIAVQGCKDLSKNKN